MTAPSAPLATVSRGELADRGYVVGARIGSETEPRRLGTIIDVPGSLLIAVRWDDGMYEQRSWLSIAPLGAGYRLSTAEVRRLAARRAS